MGDAEIPKDRLDEYVSTAIETLRPLLVERGRAAFALGYERGVAAAEAELRRRALEIARQ